MKRRLTHKGEGTMRDETSDKWKRRALRDKANPKEALRRKDSTTRKKLQTHKVDNREEEATTVKEREGGRGGGGRER